MCEHFGIHFPTEEQCDDENEHDIRHIKKAIAKEKVLEYTVCLEMNVIRLFDSLIGSIRQEWNNMEPSSKAWTINTFAAARGIA